MKVGPVPLSASQRPRAVGEVRLSSKSARRSVLDGLRQAGSLKVLFPQGDGPGLTAMLLNTAGGVTGGDRFRLTASAGRDSRLTLTTQAAERIYAAAPDETGSVTNTLEVADGARLDWLPQETILFDHSSMRRSLTAEVGPGGTLLACEALVLGRPAMGETVRQTMLRDRLRITRGGAPVLADAIRLDGDAAALFARPGIAAGMGAVASLTYVAPDAAQLAPRLRALLPATAGASLIAGDILFARVLAPDAFVLRQTLVPALTLLHGHALPRSWML